MDGYGKPQNLKNFAAISREILRTGPRNLEKFAAENCESYLSIHSQLITLLQCTVSVQWHSFLWSL